MNTLPPTRQLRTRRISADRLLADLRTLATLGGRPDGGVDRIAGSPADRDARRWLLGGVSHSPGEHTDDELVVGGAEVLLDAVAEVIQGTDIHGQSHHPGLERLNQLTQAKAETLLRVCCGSQRWAVAVASGRPYATIAALYHTAERAWWSLDEPDWREAFAAHPRIGEREAADSHARREQSGVVGASADTLAVLAGANRAYEARFGRVFLICASGRSADEMLAFLRERLNNDAETELRITAGEQSKITRLRLERLLG